MSFVLQDDVFQGFSCCSTEPPAAGHAYPQRRKSASSTVVLVALANCVSGLCSVGDNKTGAERTDLLSFLVFLQEADCAT
jgi:hypothetical protein